ncbi:MAG: ABC-2 type transporter [Methanomassiliicoccales archaeon PtaB.Bin215]|nr:MAG: ABC-2 type transporter [Methanomassiliicoccales archaeon PtaB.Bin215]
MVASFRHQAAMFLAEPQWLIPNVIAPFVLAMVVLMLYREPSPEAVLYAVLGGGMMDALRLRQHIVENLPAADRWWGTVDAIFSAPSPLIWIIGGRTIWNAFIGIVNGLFVLVAAMVIFQTPLEVADFWLFLLAFVLTLLSLAALGMLFSAAFVLTRSAQVLTNGLEFPIYVGTGSMFPIFLLPYWTHPLSYSLAPTWGIDAIRYAALPAYADGFAAGYWGDILYMAILALFYLTVSIWLYRAVDHRARKTANLMRY